MADSLFELTPVEEVYAESLGSTPKARKVAAMRIGKMWNRYGKGPDGMRCGDCVNLVVVRFSGTYHKCTHYGDSRGPGTDWRMKWPACGAFIHVNRIHSGELKK